MKVTPLCRACALGLLVLATPYAGLARAQARQQLPPVDRVGFAPAAGARLPLDAAFRDETGAPVHLRDYVAGRPAVVVPGYYGCSNLCSLVLAGVQASVAKSGLAPGRDVEVVAIGIDPREGPGDARQREASVLGRTGVSGWHFLTGPPTSIDAVAKALGYRYAWDAAEGQYAHAAGVAVVGSDGRIVQTLYGVRFAPRELVAAVRAAATPSGATPARGSIADAAGEHGESPGQWLLCFHYDPTTGRYTTTVLGAVRAAGMATLLALLAALGWHTWRRRHSTEKAS